MAEIAYEIRYVVMDPPRPIRTSSVSDLVYERLREEIVSTVRSPGDRLNYAAVADELGVSRTPVREAMVRLAKEGFLTAHHHRGFSVAELDPVEIRETYPIITALEVAGLRLGVPEIFEELDELGSLNARLGNAIDPSERYELDVEWHRSLIAPSGNERLLEAVSLHKHVIRRYDHRYMDDVGHVLGSVEEHQSILTALDERAVEDAARRLERHWRRGMEEVLKWVDT